MREIKFRALSYHHSANKDIWHYGGLTENKKGYSIRMKTTNGYYGHFIKRTETIGQYSGLKDASGVDIYEGDLLAERLVAGESKYIKSKCVVIFSNGMFLANPLNKLAKGTQLITPNDVVIGNIHEY